MKYLYSVGLVLTLALSPALTSAEEASSTPSIPTRDELEEMCAEKLGILDANEIQPAIRYNMRRCINSKRRQFIINIARQQRMSKLSNRALSAHKRFANRRSGVRHSVHQNLTNLRFQRFGGTKRLSTRARRAQARATNRSTRD